MMVAGARKMKFGWFGDGGHGERMIELIVSGKKTATASLAYEIEDSDLKAGDRLELVDKKGRVHGSVVIVDIQLRKVSTLDEMIAKHCGHENLAAMLEAARFANARELRPDEDMRVTFFRFVGLQRARP